ncbi:MAG TPA: hypothetical protein DCG75_01815 [Bacteroidales bacterium]|nr:hypothetical protein [Bacteroidales bacterium]
MKHFFFLLFTITFLTILLISCDEDSPNQKPIAAFSINDSSAFIGDTMTFVNLSENAASYMWSFGDGVISTEENPFHIYSTKGIFSIELMAINEEGVDTSSISILIEKKIIDKETIIGKWNVESQNKVQYVSFEFNDYGNFIIELQNTNFSFGFYEILGENTIELIDLGIINFTEINETDISFKLTPYSNQANVITIGATKIAVTNNSAKSKLLCRLWELASMDGNAVESYGIETVVGFSNSGTYFVYYSEDDNSEEIGKAFWTWKDASEEYMCYSWEETPICDGENVVSIDVSETELITKENESISKFRPLSSVYSKNTNHVPLKQNKVFNNILGK